MMAGIHGREPDACHYQHKQEVDSSQLVFDTIIQHDQRIRSMQRRHGSEHIRAFSIQGFEYPHMKNTVERREAGGITRCARDKAKTILLYIPGRRCRINIIERKSYQVHQQKAERKIKELPAVLKK